MLRSYWWEISVFKLILLASSFDQSPDTSGVNRIKIHLHSLSQCKVRPFVVTGGKKKWERENLKFVSACNFKYEPSEYRRVCGVFRYKLSNGIKTLHTAGQECWDVDKIQLAWDMVQWRNMDKAKSASGFSTFCTIRNLNTRYKVFSN
jgi:hypothetical protein